MVSSGRVSARSSEALVESRPKLLSLSPSQAAELRGLGRRLASAKAHWSAPLREDEDEPTRTVIRCVPAGDGLHEVTIFNAVGLIGVSGLQLEVTSKIPLSHLLYLLSHSDVLPRMDTTRVSAAADDSLWDLVARWYVEALEGVLRRGLLSDYRRERDLLPVARGQVLALATVSAYYTGRIGVASEFDEFDEDTALNRVLLAAARAIAESPLLDPQVRGRALVGVSCMHHIGQLQPQDVGATVDRRSAYYREALALGRHVLDATGRTIAAGAEQARVFLLRTPELAESGIRAILAAGLRDLVAVRKRGLQLRHSKLTLNPDLVFGDIAVGDVKYKLGGSEWNRADFYQAVAFATGFRVRHVAVVSFGVQSDPLPPTVEVGDIKLRPFRWNIEPSVSPAQAAAQLTSQIGNWISSLS